jgi:predicted acyltransferase
MFLMIAEVTDLCKLPATKIWSLLCYHQTHVEWTGCSLHDLIQPSFSFLVGVALPFSLAGRIAHAQSKLQMLAHAIWRSFILIFLGVFLRSTNSPITNFTFEDTLSQIGLGYTFLFLLGLCSIKTQCNALVVILVGYWAAFALYPLPSSEFDYPSVGVPQSWPFHLTGFAAHWNKNSNLAWAFDTWFLNLFPRTTTFLSNRGGYATTNFIPTLATMILGLLAGNILKSSLTQVSKIRWLILAAFFSLSTGWFLARLGLCPIVKRIWTPSWVLYSGGFCFLFLTSFFAIIDIAKFKSWSLPLRVIGVNSIAAYCMTGLFERSIAQNLHTHIGTYVFEILGSEYEPLLHGLGVVLALWLMLYWMYKREIYIKV